MFSILITHLKTFQSLTAGCCWWQTWALTSRSTRWVSVFVHFCGKSMKIRLIIIWSQVEESDAGVRVCWDQEGETLILTHFYVFHHGRHFFSKGRKFFLQKMNIFLQKEKVFFQRSGFVIVGGRQSRRQVQQGRDYFILMPFHGNFVVILLYH